jgi:uncharacterized protein YdhG (YjbR/CyaY superfamily)
MTAAEIDTYLAGLDETRRETLDEVRRRILAVIPEAEQCISYSVPAFRVDGKTVAGLAAFKNHLSYLPHSGSVLPSMAAELGGYEQTKSALHFPIDQPLDRPVIAALIATKMREVGLHPPAGAH